MGTPLALFPVPQRLQTDPEHAGELTLGRVKLVPNLHDVNLRELDMSTAAIRSRSRLQGTLDVTEWILKWARGTGIPRPAGRRVEPFRFFIDKFAPLAVSMRFVQRLTDRDLKMIALDRNLQEPLKLMVRKRLTEGQEKK